MVKSAIVLLAFKSEENSIRFPNKRSGPNYDYCGQPAGKEWDDLFF